MNKIQVDKNGCKYILFRIDVYFNKFLLAVEIHEKGHTDRDLILGKKGKKHQKKNLVLNLLELIQVMQKMVMIQIMRLVIQKHLLISLTIKKVKELEDKIKEKEEKSNKKIKEVEAKLKKLEDKNKNLTTKNY